jgi:hypothetical protein
MPLVVMIVNTASPSLSLTEDHEVTLRNLNVVILVSIVSLNFLMLMR